MVVVSKLYDVVIQVKHRLKLRTVRKELQKPQIDALNEQCDMAMLSRAS